MIGDEVPILVNDVASSSTDSRRFLIWPLIPNRRVEASGLYQVFDQVFARSGIDERDNRDVENGSQNLKLSSCSQKLVYLRMSPS